MELPKDKYEYVLSVLKDGGRGSDGLTDEQWVADFDRESQIKKKWDNESVR